VYVFSVASHFNAVRDEQIISTICLFRLFIYLSKQQFVELNVQDYRAVHNVQAIRALTLYRVD